MAKEITEQEAREKLESSAKNITEEDLEKILNKQEELQEKFNKGPLGKYLDTFKDFVSMIKDYISGEYKEVLWWTIAAIAAALLYVLSPIDLIPDFIPFAGLLDDAMIIAVCLTMVEEDLKKYRAYKNKRLIS